jgi:hypothetical protein|tara:strand:+ start:554 stop:964 length:411 start_codon:yes stop_codon:yes gene_type:complete
MQKSKEILEYCDSILEFTLRDSLSELRHKNRNEYVSKCNTKYPEFFKRYPALFFKIIDNPNGFKNNGRKRLLKFLNIKEDIDLKKISHEEASKNIGRKYYNEYVKPVIKEDNTRTGGTVKNQISEMINNYKKDNNK